MNILDNPWLLAAALATVAAYTVLVVRHLRRST